VAAAPDYSEEIAREIDDEIRRVIEESQERAGTVLTEHIDELHSISELLIERETIDKDQFERLLAGEPDESVFPEPEHERKPRTEPKPRTKPKPRPFPIPEAPSQPPPPEGAPS
jgi:cell division protease FtsH